MATCAEKLELVENAIHDLITGKKIVDVSYGERRVRYTEADLAQLRAYRTELLAECGTAAQVATARRRPLRPLY